MINLLDLSLRCYYLKERNNFGKLDCPGYLPRSSYRTRFSESVQGSTIFWNKRGFFYLNGFCDSIQFQHSILKRKYEDKTRTIPDTFNWGRRPTSVIGSFQSAPRGGVPPGRFEPTIEFKTFDMTVVSTKMTDLCNRPFSFSFDPSKQTTGSHEEKFAIPLRKKRIRDPRNI